ncbi:class I SAM-dependent methyltransferase [uncultured Arthrobacter sp.]|uniref:class I SAM-dependent DNA methyltransferase n=1 Tax=uncultured Arthrobacter sp. TaxID=114050 RepID=UPI0032167705
MANPGTLAHVRSAYDALAETYAAALPDTSFESPLDVAMIDEFSALLRCAPGRKVIDAGCGAGRMSALLSGAGLVVTGVDLSPVMVQTARRLHPGLMFDVGELADLPADDGAADGILAWYSIIHSSPAALPAIVREFWRTLRPGGLALIAFQAGSGHRTIERAYGHDVELRAELHAPDDVALRFTEQGFVLRAQLLRAARSMEKDPQAVLLVAKPPAPLP